VLSGRKRFVLDGHVADTLIVVARIGETGGDRDGLSLFLVDPQAEGVSIERATMVDSRNAANIELENVSVSGDAVLGGTDMLGKSAAALDAVLDVARIGLAAEMLGGINEAFERTLAYLKLRDQFGVKIGSFQALKHRAAVMFTEVEIVTSVVRAGLSALDDRDEEVSKLASLAKAKANEIFFLVSNESIQMHGGIGMTDEEEIGFFLKRARVAQHTFGDDRFHRDRYARLCEF
jgi:alkylation response protein AidB-like acyl-CoA dehydrogenase